MAPIKLHQSMRALNSNSHLFLAEGEIASLRGTHVITWLSKPVFRAAFVFEAARLKG
jgi:hypothetical protein